jgi:hypothetical protein
MPASVVYAIGSAALLGALAAAVWLAVGPAEAGSVWVAAGVAYGVQLLAFTLLAAGRKRGSGFMIGWGLGMLLRFGALAGMAVLVTVSEALDPATALLCLIGFMMVLVLIEPFFLRWAD